MGAHVLDLSEEHVLPLLVVVRAQKVLEPVLDLTPGRSFRHPLAAIWGIWLTFRLLGDRKSVHIRGFSP